MRITNVRHWLTMDGNSPALLLRIETDTGLVGCGEGTIHFFSRAVACVLTAEPRRRPKLKGLDGSVRDW